MKSSLVVTMTLMAAGGALGNTHLNLHHVRVPVSGTAATMPRIGAPTPQGCYSSAPNMTNSNMNTQYLSSGSCTKECISLKLPVSAIGPDSCYCGTTYPPKDASISLDKCNFPCNGFPQEACGGLQEAYSIYNNGLVLVPDTYQGSSSSSASSSASSKTSDTASSSASTATVTETQSQASQQPQKTGGGSNTAAIAAGVVVGVVVAAALIGGIIFFIRRKRNAEIEEEHRRNAAVNAFISGSKPASTSGGISITDSRLDPVMAHHRLSDGSLADNQDYSRKILRVTNA